MTQQFHFWVYKSEETQTTNSKEYIHLYAHCSIIYNGQDREATQVSINSHMDLKSCGALTSLAQLVGHHPAK